MLANRLFEQMDRFFGPTGFDSPDVPPPTPAYPPLSVWEDQDALYVEAEVPGVKPDDIEVSVAEGNHLTIAGARKPSATGRATRLHQECGYGRFTRTIALPVDVDPGAAEAKYDAGVITITLRKSDAMKPRRIAVKTAEPLPELTNAE